MQYLYDHTGKRYLDLFAGVSVLNCGHCNPDILGATQAQLATLQHTSTIFLTEPMVQLAERLAEVLPGELRHTFFCVTGSEANEGALTLARMQTGRKGFLALNGGLHGRTFLTLSVTGIPMWRIDPALDSQPVYFIDRPFSLETSIQDAMRNSLLQLDEVLSHQGDQIAAMILEPIQGNGGIIMYPTDYLRQVKSRLERYGVLLILDEVQTGYGRTGTWFACEHYDVVPDIIVTAKALGNGIPISTFSTNDALAASFNRPSASTFGGNPVAAVTALAVLDYIQAHDLPNRSRQLGDYLKTQLSSIDVPFIREIRGTGLMLGLQVMPWNDNSAAMIVDDVLEAMKDRGFLLGKNGLGRDVIALQPPLVLDRADTDDFLDQFQDVLRQFVSKNT